MEKLARRIADAIGNATHQDEEKRQVVAYGLAALFQMFVIFIITFSIGLLGDFAIESLVLFLGVGLLRRTMGGAHASTMTGCLVISISFITILAAASRYLFSYPKGFFLVIGLSVVIYAVSFALIYRLAPVDTPNKPIVKKEKIKRLRKEAFLTFSIYVVSSAVLLSVCGFNSRCLNIAVSFSLATIWQCFMLTAAGHTFIAAIDRMFSSTSSHK